MATKTNTKTKQNRAETERRLIDAALDLIRRNGVLARRDECPIGSNRR
jgi:AcrR family transcriptional regulator